MGNGGFMKLIDSDFSVHISNSDTIRGKQVINTVFGYSLKEINAELNNMQINDMHCFKFKNGSNTLYTVRILN